MISIRALRKRLGGREVLRGIDLDIADGEAFAVIGPSGTGKSVLLKHLIGLLEPDEGDVIVAGRSVARARYRELRRLRTGMGYVFQDAALLDSLTIRENLRLALDDRACAARPEYARERMQAVLAAVNLDADVLERYPAELSGGMRKRVAVARAIINAPQVILYDEPTTGLDPRNAAAIAALIRATHEQLGATSVIVTHDLPSLGRVADRVALLEGGRIRFVGTPDELFASADPFVAAFRGHNQEDSWRATPAAATH